ECATEVRGEPDRLTAAGRVEAHHHISGCVRREPGIELLWRLDQPELDGVRSAFEHEDAALSCRTIQLHGLARNPRRWRQGRWRGLLGVRGRRNGVVRLD